MAQLNIFSPDIAHAMAALRPLQKAIVHFQWTKFHDDAFKKVRQIVTSDVCVRPFNKDLPVRLLVDASRLHGMGYCLTNVKLTKVTDKDGAVKEVEQLLIIQCNSRTLSDAERRYAVNELEMSAVVWSVLDCKFFLHGIPHFEIISDHKSLVQVFKQPLADVVNSRMLRLREKILDYNFTLQWAPGNKHLLADALSRRPLFAPPEDPEADLDDHGAVANIIAADPSLQELYDAAEADQGYQTLVAAIKRGTPFSSLSDTHYTRDFKSVYEDLSVHDDCLVVLHGHRIVVPKAARGAVLQQLHAAHPGIVRSLQLARNLFMWPNMTNEIRMNVSSCEECQRNLASKPAGDITPYAETSEALQFMGTDLFAYGGNHHLVLVDKHTGMLCVKRLKRETSTAVSDALESFFRLIGYPQTLLSDNGPAYSSEEFAEYCEKKKISHITSSPHNPRSNGFSESAVASAKGLLQKCENFNEFQHKLLHMMNIPSAGSNQSPAERFFGRRLRTELPMLSDFYDPNKGKDFTPLFSVGQNHVTRTCLSPASNRSSPSTGTSPSAPTNAPSTSTATSTSTSRASASLSSASTSGSHTTVL